MTAEAPRVDVGIVTWNTRDLTVRALRRLVEDGAGCRLRILVHDNGSTDGTAEAIARAVPEAEVVAGETNLGFAAGVNRLLARSDAPWFLMLNSDAWPRAGAVRALVECAERHPRAAVVAPLLQTPDGVLEHSTHPFPSPVVAVASGLALTGRWAWRHALHGAWRHDCERQVDWAVGAALLLRRAALDEVGGFDDSFFMYAEDLEWCHRARRAGWEVWFTPAATVVHVGNASGAEKYGDLRTATWVNNSYRFYRREHGAVATAVYRLANVASVGVTGARAWAGGDAARARHWWRQVPLHLRSR